MFLFQYQKETSFIFLFFFLFMISVNDTILWDRIHFFHCFIFFPHYNTVFVFSFITLVFFISLLSLYYLFIISSLSLHCLFFISSLSSTYFLSLLLLYIFYSIYSIFFSFAAVCGKFSLLMFFCHLFLIYLLPYSSLIFVVILFLC